MNRVVFLDTNIFESAKFSYKSHRMERFLETCEDKDIDLYITDVVKHEVKKRILNNIEEAIENIDKHNISILENSLNIENLERIKLIEHLSEKLIKDFEDFIDDYNITVIPSSFDQEKLLNLYFENKVPFSEQKKHEFPDAIIILTIKKWSNINNRIPLFISNDKGLSDFCEEDDISVFPRISDVTHLLLTENPEGDLLEIYNEQLENIQDALIDSIKGYENDFILYSYDSIDDIEVNNVKIKNILLEKIDIINIDIEENIIQLEVNLTIEFSFNASYPDMDTMSRDKEDGVNYFWLHNNAELNLKENTTCFLDVIIHRPENEFDIDNLEISNKEFEFWLDENNIINIEQYESYSSSKW